MILHTAMFSFHDEVDDDDVRGLTTALLEMAARVDSVLEYRCGPNARVFDSDVDYVVMATVADEPGLRDYLGHPAHDAVVEQWLGRMVAERHAAQLTLPADRT